MSNLTRKDFLRLSSWGVVATLLTAQKINALSSILIDDKNSTSNDFAKAQELAKEARVLFYQKNFKKAEELYLQCIKLAPNSIRFYDNLDNVYGAKSDLLSSVELFKNGLLLNQKNTAFYDRAARSLMRLELGNRKQANLYKNKIKASSLLEDAKTLLINAIALDASKKYLAVSFTKIQKKIARNDNKDAKSLLVLNKEEKKNNRILYKNSFKAKTQEEITKLLDKVDSKKRVKLYHVKEIEHQKKQISKQKIKYNQILLSKLDKNDPKRGALKELIFNLDTANPTALHQLKKEYYKQNRYADFIAIRQEFAAKKQTFYSNLGLMDAIEKAYLERQVAADVLEKAAAIGKDLYENWLLLDNKKVDVVNKLSKIYILQQQFDDAKKIIEDTINTCSSNSPTIVNKLLYSYAAVFFEAQEFEKARQIVQIAIEKEEIGGDFYKNILKLSKNKEAETFKDKLSLYYLLYKIYNSSNQPKEAIIILEKLQQNNPNDKFVLTRI